MQYCKQARATNWQVGAQEKLRVYICQLGSMLIPVLVGTDSGMLQGAEEKHGAFFDNGFF
jgi:hypothetical protein